MPKKLILVFVGILVAGLGLAFYFPRHKLPTFLKESRIPFEWNVEDEVFAMSCKDQGRLQIALKREGFSNTGWADYADNREKFGTNIWTRGDSEIEEGPNSAKSDDCFLRLRRP
jgi:hypothetical protein